MGVDITNFLIYGFQIPWNDKLNVLYNEKCEEIEQSADFSIILDGMCGDYIVVGVVLCFTDQYMETVFKEIDLNTNWKEIENNIKKEFAEYFPELKDLVPEKFSLLYFNHYS